MTYVGEKRLRIAVVGAGISGLSAAWLLSQRHDVTVFEKEPRLGGHSNTLDVSIGGRTLSVDTGFIVYNVATYPNLIALFAHLGVATRETDMSFGVSLDGGRLEYGGGSLSALFAQPTNVLKPRFWSMLRETLRFYREAAQVGAGSEETTLDQWLDARGYGQAFRADHLYPMAAAIWSTPAGKVGAQPAQAFMRFCQNHGLLQLTNRPQWRTVVGGSRSYVTALREASRATFVTGAAIQSITRDPAGVMLAMAAQAPIRFDHVVIAIHADQALALLSDPSPEEQALLSPFRYARNATYLHSDTKLMPRRKSVWSAWNYLADTRELADTRDGGQSLSVTYWMNKLQSLAVDEPVLVTLNPPQSPSPDLTHAILTYEHPQFDLATLKAQQKLWSLQGQRRSWFCGAHFGAGFHEDGLQSGLAVAEQLGGVLRPWHGASGLNGRIVSLQGISS